MVPDVNPAANGEEPNMTSPETTTIGLPPQVEVIEVERHLTREEDAERSHRLVERATLETPILRASSMTATMVR